MPLTAPLAQWNAAGIEPPQSLKDGGWQAGMKPPDAYFNWYMYNTYRALLELQTKAALKDELTSLREENETNKSKFVQLAESQSITVPRNSLAKPSFPAGKTLVNLAPLFDSGLWILDGLNMVSPTELAVTITDATIKRAYYTVDVKADTIYTFAVDHNSKIGVYSEDLTVALAAYSTAQTVSFNSGTHTKVRLYVRADVNGTFSFKNARMNEGTAAQPFVANIKGLLNPTVNVKDAQGNVASSVTLADELFEGEQPYQDANGNWRKNKRFNRFVLDGNLSWAYSTDYAGHKRFSVPVPNAIGWANDNAIDDPRVKLIKNNGKLLKPVAGGVWTSPDVFELNMNASNALMVTVSDADTGFGETYVPTAAEIKAIFNGWKWFPPTTARDKAMFFFRNDKTLKQSVAATAVTTAGNTLTVADGTLYAVNDLVWFTSDGIISIGRTVTGISGNVLTVDGAAFTHPANIIVYNMTGATLSDRWGSNAPPVHKSPSLTNRIYEPYNLVYQLATEQDVPVKSFGDVLLLKEGANMVELAEAVIRKEKATFVYPGSGNWIYTNLSGAVHPVKGSELKYRLSSVLEMDKDGLMDKVYDVSQPSSNAFGNNFIQININNFNYASVYEVDYIAMPYYSAPLTAATLEYYENIGTVLNETVDAVVEIKKEMSEQKQADLSMFAKKKQEGWITALLLNGWVHDTAPNTLDFKKDEFGRVTIQGTLKDGVVTSTTTLFILPEGYRPKKSIRGAMVRSNDSTFVQISYSTSGTVQIVGTTTAGVFTVNTTFDTE